MSSPATRERADHDTTSTVAQTVMRLGLVAAFVLMLVGLIADIVAGGPATAVSYAQMRSGTSAGDRILMVGALVLALTPAVQIVTLLVGWWRQRDYRYAGVALAVIVVLAVGATLGAA